ncbi:hypothetical protein [Geomonas terrae]|uniref:hypothetical protein n=1 Tax=Geomonas terrae TaxID=2562681 RepID=UPI0018E06672|nr:hypothetical protein [Geomonas terrae]
MIIANCLVDIDRLGEIIQEAKKLAWEYKMLTGKPLGITGEVAEYEAARQLNLQLCDARQAGHDATQKGLAGEKKIQIKGRCVTSKKSGQRVPSIKLTHDWDSVMLVLLDDNFEPIKILEAERSAVEQVLTKPGSKSRNERGSMSISQFNFIARQVWPKEG